MNEVHLNAHEIQFIDENLNCVKIIPFEFLVHPTIRPMVLGVIGGWVRQTDVPKGVWLVDSISLIYAQYNLAKLNQPRKQT